MLGACEGLAPGLSPDLGLPCRGSDGGSQWYIPECAPFSFHLVWPMGQAAWEKGQLSVLHFVSFPGSGLLLLFSGPLSTNPTLSRRAVHNPWNLWSWPGTPQTWSPGRPSSEMKPPVGATPQGLEHSILRHGHPPLCWGSIYLSGLRLGCKITLWLWDPSDWIAGPASEPPFLTFHSSCHVPS